MAGFGSVVLWNAVLAIVLAGFVLLISQMPAVKRRPAVRHTLWLLVLAKLITPPLIQLPLPWPEWLAFDEPEISKTSDSAVALSAIENRPDDDTPANEPGATISTERATDDAALRTSGTLSFAELAGIGLLAVSVAGTAILIAVVLMRARRINRILAQTENREGQLQQEATTIARKLGLPFEPVIRVVGADITPMLWARPRRPVVVLPERLIAELDRNGVASVIAHELAHWIRQDHWTNSFAFAVAACFWWNPITWYAYRKLREAQEECCDALLLAHGTAERRQYAETLLAVLDFQSAAGPTIPIVSPGIGGTNSLRRRFEMLRDSAVDHRLTWFGKVLVAAMLMILPSVPTWSQPAGEPVDSVAQPADEASSTPAEGNAAISVQELIDAAKPGEVVTIPAGTYTAPVTIDKPLTLKGGDATKCVFEVTADAPAIGITAQKLVRLEALTIKWQLATSDGRQEAATAMVVKDGKARLVNCRFEALGNIKRSPAALVAMGFSDVEVQNCWFNGFEFTIAVQGGAEASIVESVVRKPGHCGISVYDGSTVEVMRSIVTGSEFHGVRSTGGKLVVKDSLIIENNNRGVYLGNKSATGSIVNNAFVGNGSGVSAFAQSQVTIANNVFLNSGYSALDTRDSCRLTIRNNIFQNNPRGFVVYPEAGRNQFKFGRNVAWSNGADMENFESQSIDKVDPQLKAPAHGDFTVEAEAVRSARMGLTNPEVIQELWKKWEAMADKRGE